MPALTQPQIDTIHWTYGGLEKALKDESAMAVIPTDQRYELLDTDWCKEFEVDATFQNYLGRVKVTLPFHQLQDLSEETQKSRKDETGTINHLKNKYRDRPDDVELLFPVEGIDDDKLEILNQTMRFLKPVRERDGKLVMSLTQYRGIMSFCQANVEELNRGGNLTITKAMLDRISERWGLSRKERDSLLGLGEKDNRPAASEGEPKLSNADAVVGYSDTVLHETKAEPRIRGLAAIEALGTSNVSTLEGRQRPSGQDRPNNTIGDGSCEVVQLTFGKGRPRA